MWLIGTCVFLGFVWIIMKKLVCQLTLNVNSFFINPFWMSPQSPNYRVSIFQCIIWKMISLDLLHRFLPPELAFSFSVFSLTTMQQAANIPLVCELGIDKLSFDDFSLDVDAMLTAALRMFMELGMVQKFKIDYEASLSFTYFLWHLRHEWWPTCSVHSFGLPLQILCRWLLTVRKNYRMVPYHNWRHAFNVCQCMFAMLTVKIMLTIDHWINYRKTLMWSNLWSHT